MVRGSAVGAVVRGSGGVVGQWCVAHLKAAALGMRCEDARADGVGRRRHGVDLDRHDGLL